MRKIPLSVLSELNMRNNNVKGNILNALKTQPNSHDGTKHAFLKAGSTIQSEIQRKKGRYPTGEPIAKRNRISRSNAAVGSIDQRSDYTCARKMSKSLVSLLATLMLVLIPGVSFGNLLSNPGFDEPPILVSPQTDVSLNQQKNIRTSSTDSLFAEAISGVSGWTYWLNPSNGHSDQGLSRWEVLGGSSTDAQGFINWHDQRYSQTVAETVEADRTYTASIEFAVKLDDANQPRAGSFELWAGRPIVDDENKFEVGSVLLDSVLAGINWSVPVDVEVVDATWVTLDLSYTAAAGDPLIGKPLTLSFKTMPGSAGTTYWDNANLSSVPEPATIALLGLGVAGIGYQRRKVL